MAKSCPIGLMSEDEYKNGRALLDSAIDEVNDGSYTPRRVHGFLSAPKGCSVARFMPVLTFTDTAVYFACMQQIDKKLAGAAVENTLVAGNSEQRDGKLKNVKLSRCSTARVAPPCRSLVTTGRLGVSIGRSIGSCLRRNMNTPTTNPGSLCSILANFYDSVDLRRLETSVRATSGDEHFAINVLFHFLGSWIRALSLYNHSTKGLPMDLVGDCSRLFGFKE